MKYDIGDTIRFNNQKGWIIRNSYRSDGTFMGYMTNFGIIGWYEFSYLIKSNCLLIEKACNVR
jgi:hypothetical protein